MLFGLVWIFSVGLSVQISVAQGKILKFLFYFLFFSFPSIPLPFNYITNRRIEMEKRKVGKYCYKQKANKKLGPRN